MFEKQLIESQPHKGTGKKPLTFIISLLIHVVVIGSVVAASLWFVEEVPEPPIPVQFYASAPPPPPPPPAAPAKPATPKQAPKVEPVKPTQLTTPTVIPENIPQPLAAPEPEPSSEGVEGGVEGGVPGGVVGGVLGGTPGGTGDGLAPLRIGGDVKAPILKERIEPVYPEAARKARMQGVVILEAIITAEGTVANVKVLKSVNPLLDSAAERAVSQWVYKPATLNGRSVAVFLTVTVNFQLH
jgi:protein TonB